MTPELLNLVVQLCTMLATPGIQRKGFLARPLLDAMSTEWSLVVFPLQRPKTDDNGNIVLGKGKDMKLWKTIRQMNPTLISVLKGNATVLRLFDRDAEGTAVVRAWGDLRTFGIRGGEKVAKRLSALWQEVSHYLVMPDIDMFEAQLVVVNGQPVAVRANREMRRATNQQYGKGSSVQGGKTIATYSVSDDLEKVFDGKGNYIRPSVAAEMTNEALNRARTRDPRLAKLLVGFSVSMVDGKMVNNIPVTAGPYARRLFTRRFAAKVMNGRMILPIVGMVKGDWIIAASDDALCADFVVCTLNIKPELFSLNGTVYFTANPVYENRHRKTSRQSIAHLHSWVLPHGRLVNNMQKYIDRTVASFRTGLPEWIGARALEDLHRDDAINDVQRKSDFWVDAGLSLSVSPFLTSMLRRQFFEMNFKKDKPKDDDKFPLQAGEFRSAKSLADLIIAGYAPVDFELPEGVWMDSLIGMITADPTYVAMLRVLGVGDGDDHVEILMLIALYAIVVDGLSFEAGDMVSVVGRYPIGYSSDGIDYGSEYFILKPSKEVTEQYVRDYPGGLQTVDLAMRPIRADRITINQTLFPEPMVMDSLTDYTYENARLMFWACTYSLRTGGIGAMANLQMLAALMGVAIELPCDTETMVDAVAGVAPSFRTSDEALAAVRAGYRQLEALGLPIDAIVLDRPGMENNFSPDVKTDKNGFLTQLYKARDAMFARAGAEIDTIAAEGLDELRRMFGGISWKPWRGGDAPLLVNIYREAFESTRRITGESDHLRFRRVGDAVVAKMEELGYMGIMDRALVQAIAHQLTTDTPVSSMRDQMFFQGELFTHTLELYSRLFADDETEALVAINCTATTHADGCELLDSVSPAELHAFIARGHLSDDCYEAGMTSWRTS